MKNIEKHNKEVDEYNVSVEAENEVWNNLADAIMHVADAVRCLGEVKK